MLSGTSNPEREVNEHGPSYGAKKTVQKSDLWIKNSSNFIWTVQETGLKSTLLNHFTEMISDKLNDCHHNVTALTETSTKFCLLSE